MSCCAITAPAQLDLRGIKDYIAQHSPENARRFIASLEKKCWAIADCPGMGPRRDDLRPELRSFPVGNYIIFYRPVEDGIEVIRVLHGNRDIEAIFAAESGQE